MSRPLVPRPTVFGLGVSLLSALTARAFLGRRRLPRLISLVCLTLAAFAAGGTSDLRASYPGSNGKIAFHRPMAGNFNDVWVINPDGSGETNLTDSAQLHESLPAFSPDGTQIAYLRQEVSGARALMVMDANGANQRLIATTAGGAQNLLGAAPSWSPDGTRIAIGGVAAGVFAIKIYNVTGAQLVDTLIPPSGAGYTSFSWRPTAGSAIDIAAVKQYPGTPLTSDIVRVTSTGEVNLTNTPGDFNEFGQLHWTPDGAKVVYRLKPVYDVVALAVAGGQTTLHGGSGVAGGQDVSPDGTALVFDTPTSNPTIAPPISIRALAGGGPIPLTTGFNPCWGGKPNGFTLTIAGTAPQAQGVKSGDTVHYTLALTGPTDVVSLTVTATLRADLATVHPATITQGGVLAGDKITWTLGALPTVPLAFDATVKGQDEIPETILFISTLGTAEATQAGGAKLTANDDLALTYLRSDINVDVITNTKRPGRARPGEEVGYRLDVRVREPTDTLTVDAAIPAGTKLVPGSITNGGVAKGKRVKWKLTGVAAPPPLEYRVTVPEEKKLKGLKQLDLDVKAEAELTRGDTVTGSATHTLPLVLLIVQGTVTDTFMNFPNSNLVNTKKPLAGAEVRLLRGTEVVAEATTDKKGVYRFGADDDGTFTLEVKKKGSLYSHASNSITTEARYVVQRRQVVLQTPQAEPLVKDVILPLGLVNRAAETLQKLNNFPIPLFSGAITTNLIKLYYDTSAAETFVEGLIDEAPEFPGVFEGTGPKDAWNGLIRAVAFWAVASTRVQDAIGLADDAGKVIGLLVTVEVLKKLGQNKLISPTGSTVPELSRQRLKIGVMVSFVGAALPLILDQLGVEGQRKAQIIQIAASLIRFGVDKWTGQFTDDLVFEIIFDVLRTAVVTVTMGEIFGASSNANPIPGTGPPILGSGLQGILDDVVTAAKARQYAGSTLNTLGFINNKNDELKQSYIVVHALATSSLSIFGVFRGVKGIFEKGDKIEFKSGQAFASNRFFSDANLKKAQGLFANLAKPVQLLSIAAAAEGIGHPLVEITTNQLPETRVMADNAVQLPTHTLTTPPGRAREATIARAELLASARAIAETQRHDAAKLVNGSRAKAPPAGPAVAAYLDVMKRIEKAVKEKDGPTVATLREEQASADATVFTDYLEPLTYQIAAALPLLGTAPVTADLLAFLDSEVLAATNCGLYYAQLDLWEIAPEEVGKGPISKAGKLCTVALLAADAAAGGASAATGGVTTPGHLVITGGDLPATALTAGDTFTVAFTVTNVGDAGLPAGSATIATPGNHLLVNGATTKTVPALAAGAAATLSWSLTTEASPAAYLAGYQVEVSAGTAAPTLFTDFTLVQP